MCAVVQGVASGCVPVAECRTFVVLLLWLLCVVFSASVYKRCCRWLLRAPFCCFVCGLFSDFYGFLPLQCILFYKSLKKNVRFVV